MYKRLLSVVLGCGFLLGCSAYDPKLLGKLPHPAAGTGSSGSAGSTARADAGTRHDASADASNMVETCTASTELAICPRPNADSICRDSKCRIVRCRDGYADCDQNADTGCETTLDVPAHCGACGSRCALSHVKISRCEPSAEGGPCQIDHGCVVEAAAACADNAAENGCETGFGDCDGIAANGCETSLRTLSDCGACGTKCAVAGAEASCETGACRSGGCAPGFADCGGGSCTSLADDPMHCGACDTVCPATSSMCSGGRCTSARCDRGRADCTASAANDCETDLGSPATCGSCNVSCGPYPHASPACNAGQCALLHCDEGFADCNKTRDDGCETDVSQVSSCGACGMNCGALPHVSASVCKSGQCSDLSCEAGWGDCDGKPENGCEQSLSTLDHCGSCGSTCNPPNATGKCDSGQCAVSSCADRYDDCNGAVADGCEAALDGDANCGACHNQCASGTICQNGGCSCSGTCANGDECCSGSCIDTNSHCDPWPCIPGTSRDRSNCGGCGVECITWCCSFL